MYYLDEEATEGPEGKKRRPKRWICCCDESIPGIIRWRLKTKPSIEDDDAEWLTEEFIDEEDLELVEEEDLKPAKVEEPKPVKE